LERQETTEDVTERPFPGTCARNDEGAPNERATVAAALTEALEAWVSGGDAWELRRYLLGILDLMEHIDSSLLDHSSLVTAPGLLARFLRVRDSL
jgi:hypothetical protein